MSAATDRLVEMSYGQAFLMGLGVAIAYYLVWYDSGQSQINRAKAAQVKTAELAQDLARDQRELTRSKEFKETLRLKDEQFLTFTSYIPEQLNISDMMKSISSEAKAAGVNIMSIRESASSGISYQYTDPIAIEVELEGGFPQHILFLSYLTRLDSIFTVNSMSFKSSSSGGKKDPNAISVTFSAKIVGYRYVASAAEPAAQGRRRGR